MSVLVVGVSHKTAPVSLLERLALDADEITKLVGDVAGAEHVGEAAVIATCNRLELYADVDRFHGSVEELTALLAERADVPTGSLVPHLYVHYDDAAVSHLFRVAAGLDSMAVGEAQILGQTRTALRAGQELGTVGPALNSLFQQALRVGKRARAESEIDQAAPSLVAAGLDRNAETLGSVAGKRVVVLGAGSMAALAVATVSRAGAADIAIVNRSQERAERLAAEYAGRAVSASELGEALGAADLLITCTGARGVLVDRTLVEDSLTPGQSLVIVDLALPHDVDRSVVELPGVTLTGLAELATDLHNADGGDLVEAVREIVAQEVTAYLAARSASSVTPTVVALRSMATGVVDAEMERLLTRLPDLDPDVRAEVLQTVRRVADKLLHQPTVRVKELSQDSDKVSYSTALAELFSLDTDAVDAVTRPGGLQ